MSPEIPNERHAPWHKRAVCRECGWHTYAPFGSLFHALPTCGNPGYQMGDLTTRVLNHDRWDIRTMRWVSQSRLLNPLTWGSGYWETREESKEGMR